MKVSVIIPARNEEANIGRTLAALLEQSLPKSEFEVVLADNGSTDGTLDIANSYSAWFALTIIRSSGRSVAAVRNDGAAASAGKILAFLDADCTPKPDWLENAIKLRPSNAIWGAHYGVPDNATWVGKIWEDFQATKVEGSTRFLPTSNLFVDRDDFFSLTGFAASQQTSEDVDFSLRARKAGLNVVAIPVLAIVHEGTPDTLGEFYTQNYWHGRHVFRMFLRNLPSLKSLPVVALSVYSLFMLLAAPVALALLILGRGTVSLALIPVGLFLLPATLLALRKTMKAGRTKDAPALASLYVVYLTARALSLILPASTGHRRSAS